MQMTALAGVVDTATNAKYNALTARWYVVYGCPTSGTCELYNVPLIPAEVLARELRQPVLYVATLHKAMANSDAKKVLINAAWGFPSEIKRFQIAPFWLTFDAEHGTNKNRNPTATTCSVDGEGHNVLAAQGFLQDLKVRSFSFWFTVALPYLLTRASLLCVNALCMDGSPEQWSAFRLAKVRGLFDARVVPQLCSFHKLTMPLRSTENLGFVDVPPEIYAAIVRCLYAIASKYETQHEALTAMGCLQSYADASLVETVVRVTSTHPHIHACALCRLSVFVASCRWWKRTWSSGHSTGGSTGQHSESMTATVLSLSMPSTRGGKMSLDS